MSAPETAAGLELSVKVDSRGLDVSLGIGAGEVLAVLGPNGAGKSTLLDVVAGLVAPDAAVVRSGGRTLTDTRAGIAVPPHRRDVALLAQDPLLFPHLSVAANVAFGPRSRGMRARAANAQVRRWLAAVDAAPWAWRRPGQLSGGQAQRVALARALAVEPRLLLFDEPLAALDVAAAPAIRSLLRGVLRDPQRRDHGRTAVLVTHDIVDALTLADRVVVLESGRIAEQGTVAQVLSRPRSAFAARIAGVNLLLGPAVTTGPGTAGLRAGDVTVVGRYAELPAPGSAAAAVFSPAAVAVHRAVPEGSPRNVFRVRIAELTDRGGVIRVQAAPAHGTATGLVADLTPAAVAELGLAVGAEVWFVVKATEVQVYSLT
ncbi:sulfate/molybdate ABC transporter ATP-binding protein [Nocardia stercoris]|uniref:ABC transporter ATP-binding protein n=1 Tax=Nocardia stercoris TaxID=2483361 RepID=A0A3M2LH44_9NOCA|nr:ABC transporter ATP-binding protein [Nocardia stercoris]RMI34078.1 ABC transporter ATP-binding protein [Nocardia stercoris]